MNNDTPRSVTNPPPWANLDPRVLSPIPDKKKREACWDDSFPRGKCLQREEIRGSSKPSAIRKRPASAGVRRGRQEPPSANSTDCCNSDIGGAKRLQRGVKSRPLSAKVRGSDAACGGGGNSDSITKRSDTSALEGSGFDGNSGQLRGGSAHGSRKTILGGDNGRNHGKSSGGFATEERDILAGSYSLNESQKTTFREFVAMLVDFDTCSMVRILDDVFRETHFATGLQDFTGCGEN